MENSIGLKRVDLILLQVLEMMAVHDVEPDVDFFNQLIYKRVYREDYQSALVSIIVSLISLACLYTREFIEKTASQLW